MVLQFAANFLKSPYITAVLVISSIFIGRFMIKMIQLVYHLAKGSKYQKPDLQNRFSKSKLQPKYDYVIIGSGTSGLSSASILSKLGKKVLVLEQHDKIGGCFHTFNEKGYEFDTGFHYVGNDPILKAIISIIGSKKVEWTTHSHFDSVLIGDNYKYELEAPTKKFIKNIYDEFPKEKQVLDKYIWLSKIANIHIMALITCATLPKLLQPIFQKCLKFIFFQVHGKSTRQVFDEIGISQNKKLEVVLASMSGDIGTYLTELDFSMHAKLLSHYYTGGSMYPKLSTNAIIDSITGAVVQRGGTLLTKASVEKIMVENGQCQGVELKGGVKISCKNVISTMGIPNTLNSLPEQYRWKNDQEYDDAYNLYSLFLGINIEGMKEKMPTCNTWYFPRNQNEEQLSYDEVQRKFMETQKNEHRPLFVSFGTAKQGIENNKQAVCILTPCKWNWTEKYRVNEMRREKEYDEYKNKVQQEIVNKFLEIFPQFKGKVDYQSLGTPLTYETYYNRKTPYGTQFNTKKMYDSNIFFKTQTSIKGLHISGQDVCFPGFIGSLIAGVLTSIRATGYI